MDFIKDFWWIILMIPVAITAGNFSTVSISTGVAVRSRRMRSKVRLGR
jgi:hypothetical protein